LKKFLAAFLTVCFCLGGSYSIYAAEIEDNTTKNFTENFKKTYPNAVLKPINKKDIPEIRSEMKRNKVRAGSASPVTQLYVDQVGSALGTSDAQIEFINYAFTSHAVKGITGVAVVEMGYGSDSQWLGDELIHWDDPSYIVETSSIDLNGDNIAEGFFHVVYFDSDIKIPSGTKSEYRFQSTSYNFPGNTMRTYIYIPHQ